MVKNGAKRQAQYVKDASYKKAEEGECFIKKFVDNIKGYTLINNFNPKGKIFTFRLKHTCHRLGYGVCPLLLSEKKQSHLLLNSKNYNPYNYNSPEYCINLANSLLCKGLLNNIRITKFPKCGHYGVTDGQHRLCVAAKIGLSLPVYVSEWIPSTQNKLDGFCYVCAWEKKSFKYKVKHFFKKTREIRTKL